MATLAYMTGRKEYARPQGMLWADNPGTVIVTGTSVYHIPNGFEIGANPTGLTTSLLNQFLVLSDDNRSSIDFAVERLENRQRMINGRMRSYHIADKLTINVSWDMLPSRAYKANPMFNSTTGKSINFNQFGSPTALDSEYTSDGGAGGVEILDWYNNHPGSFWVYLAYDNYKNFENAITINNITTGAKYTQLGQYSQVIEVFFSDFNYSVQKRGGNNYDFWNISATLEEV